MIPTTNTLSSSSSITCVSPNQVASKQNSFVVFEAIYYDNANGTTNQSNQLVLAKVKNNNAITNDIKNESNPIQPILLASNIQNSTTPTTSSTTIIKKPGIILLTQASLNKLLNASDLNAINNNHHNIVRDRNSELNVITASATKCNTINKIIVATSNPTNINTNNKLIDSKLTNSKSNRNCSDNNNSITNNHVHAHHNHQINNNNINIFNECNSAIDTTNNETQTNHNHNSNNNNNQLKSVLMINSTLETTAGVVTVTSTTVPIQSINRESSDEQASTKTNDQQVNDFSLFFIF